MAVLLSSIRPPASAATCSSARWSRPGRRPTGCGACPARLGAPDVTVEITEVARCGVRATKVDVVLPGGAREHPAEPVHPNHGHDDQAITTITRTATGDGHEHGSHLHGPHRHIGDLIAAVERAPLSPWVRERAVRAFRLLGEAEGRVHGMPAEQVALHEVGAVDALIDIVGAIEGFERLGIDRVYNRPVGLGSGWVRAAHGVIPVPAPATALLLEGIDIGPNGPVSGEAVTPTGAVLLRVLSEGAPPARWRAVSGGVGGVTLSPPRWVEATANSVAYATVDGSIAPKDPKGKPINFRVLLPASWSRRSIQMGGGGMNGSVPMLRGERPGAFTAAFARTAVIRDTRWADLDGGPVAAAVRCWWR